MAERIRMMAHPEHGGVTVPARSGFNSRSVPPGEYLLVDPDAPTVVVSRADGTISRIDWPSPTPAGRYIFVGEA